MSYSVQIPDFAGNLARGEQMQASRLQMLAQREAMDDAARFRGAAPSLLAQLATAEGPARQNLIGKLADAGTQGVQLALPMMQQDRQRAQFQGIMNTVFGGAPAPAAAPAVAAPGGGYERPAGPITGPAAGGDPRALNEEAARRREVAMRLPPEQQAAALAEISAWRAAAGGTPERPGGYRANAGVDGAYAGVRPPSGVVPPVAPGGPAPAAGRALPTPQQLFQLMASGDPDAMQFAARVAPLVAQNNPTFSITEIGGRRVAVDTRDPTRTMDLGPSSDPASRDRDDRARSFADTSAIRREFNDAQAVKEYATVRPNFEAITRAQRTDTRAADIDMVFAFAKMLDPASVVREGEQITLMRTGGVFDTVAGYVSGLAGGGRLTPEVRASIVQQAQQRYQVAADAHDERLDYYRSLAEQNNLRPDQIGRYARERNPAARNTEATSPRAPGAPDAAPNGRPAPPRVGEVREGYRFRGGDPGDRNSWEAVR